ncbi:MAG: hypothetical protein LBP72_01945 [Dysgonamonadaceae bacterium]|nr:hypothetical protein [Dysgonamonadaceae bacterium]
MRHSFFFQLAAILFYGGLFFSCNEENNPYPYNEPTIYSESNRHLFSEVVFFIKPYIREADRKKFIVTDTLKNISLTINNKIKKKSDSYPLDIDRLSAKEAYADYLVTDQPIHYPVSMEVTMMPQSLTTAGQYADLLNDYLNLQPGIYICRIVSFDIKTISGELKTIYTPMLSFPLEVEENKVSAHLGEFEVEVK